MSALPSCSHLESGLVTIVQFKTMNLWECCATFSKLQIIYEGRSNEMKYDQQKLGGLQIKNIRLIEVSSLSTPIVMTLDLL